MNRKLIFLHAAWCGPCKYAERTLISKIENDCPGQIERVDVSVDRDNYCRKYKIKRCPTIILMEDGEAVKIYSGILEKQDVLTRWLKGGGLDGPD